MYKPRYYFLAFIFLSFALSACDNANKNNESATTSKPAAETVSVNDPYIRAMPPGQKVTAMFMTVNNPSLNTYNLVRAESDVSEHVELHEHKMADGMMQMGQVEKIEISAQGNTALKPGGYHIMLIGLKKDLELGQQVDVKLVFKDGSSMNLQPEVKKIAVSDN